jgi:type I restriction enzyme M protein
MLGAIIGDIAGSRFEWHNHKSKDFELFGKGCRFTDDSAMSLAVAQAILNCQGDWLRLPGEAVASMRRIGQKYPNCGYGGMFAQWLQSANPQPYHSFGNGAAMRVSACGFAGQSEAEVKQLSAAVTAVTHDHPEGIKGAEATALCIYWARTGKTQAEIRALVESRYYPLDFTLDAIRPTYAFDVTCQGSVPQAIEAFLASTDFEDAIHNAISIGGDSDTIAAITGGIAEAFYGIPELLRQTALPYLDAELTGIVTAFDARYPGNADG